MQNQPKTPLLQPKILVNFSATFTHFGKIMIKQRSQKTFAYCDTFA
jgi:hypothetical protein